MAGLFGLPQDSGIKGLGAPYATRHSLAGYTRPGHASDTNGVVVITQMQPANIVFSIPEDQLNSVLPALRAKQKLPVEAWDRDNQHKLTDGQLLTVDNQVDTTTGTVKLKAVFNNQDNALFPNQFVNVRLRTEVRPHEVSSSFHLTGWQRFWKLEVPFSMPGLIWNMMMSMSGGWFFVVASEAITVGNNTVILPGVGSFLSQAISERNLGAVGWVILTMTDNRNTADTPLWQWVEERIRRVVYRYGYQEIRLPILESAQLYAETGTAMPVSDSEVTLRPEGTLGCVKAVVDARGVGRQDARRLWYQGPMFRKRAEGLQQFHQFGVEAFGMPGPEIDAELILLSWDMFSALGLNRKVCLEINTLGTWQEQRDQAATHLGQESRLHFATLCHLLDLAGVAYQVNPLMKNGLGYYTHTVFDWTLNEPELPHLSLCSGGRYDELAGRYCGRSLSASGFALDFESVLERMALGGRCIVATRDVFALGLRIEAGQFTKQDSD